MNMMQSGLEASYLVEGNSGAHATSPFLLFMATLVATTALLRILMRHFGL
jgi:hypothetical protein